MVMAYINFVELETLMLHAKFQDPRHFSSAEDCGHLGHVTWIIYYINVLSPFARRLHMKFGFDWQRVSEEMFEKCERRQRQRRRRQMM